MKHRTRLLLFVALMITALLVAACGGDEEEPTNTPAPTATDEPTAVPTEEPTEEITVEPTEEITAEPTEEVGTIPEEAEAAESFTTLLAAIEAAGLTEALSSDDPLTVFAPTDEAFEALLAELGVTAEELLAREDLATILQYHVVAGEVMAENVMALDGETVETLAGETIAISVVDGVVVLNDTVNVVQTDVEASNGVIHVIDGVLLPPTEPEETPEVTTEPTEEMVATEEVEVTEEATVEMTVEPTEEMEPTEEATEEMMATEEMEPTEEVVAEPMGGDMDIVAVAEDAGDFSTLLAALDAAGLTETFQGEEAYTVFAPTDDAFAALLDELGVTAEDLLAREDLGTILAYHVVEGAVMAETVLTLDGETVETLAGETVAISIVDGVVVLNETVNVVQTDVEASNGVIHVIDAVLLPPAEEMEPTEEVVAEATAEPTEEMVATEEEMEPTEEVVAEATAEPTEEMVATEEEMEPTEEVVAEATAEPTEEMVATEEVETNTIVDVAVAAGDFETLVTAVEAAGLAETLSGEGPFTVFAPVDDAFEALPEGTLDALLSSPISIQAVLSYHVISGVYTAEDLTALDGETVQTLFPDDPGLTFTVEDGTVFVNGVEVIQADVEADNGVIHVINGVLLPEMAAGFAEQTATEEAEMMATEEAEVMATPEPMDMAGTITSACMVADQGGIDDGTFNQLAFNGLTRAAEDFGLETRVLESNTPSDFEPNINSCIDEGFGAVVTVGFLMTDTTLASAQANPDVYFIAVDQEFENAPDNLVGLQFREDQSGFLVGVMAAMMTETDTIAGVYGISVPAVVKFRNGFEQGAKYINPDITTLGVYGESFIDAAWGAETAEALIGQGADVIFGAGGATGSGGIIYAAGEGYLVIGVDQDEYFTSFGGGETPGAENIITSATKAVDVGVYDMLDALSDGNVMWPGGSVYVLDATNDGVGYAPSHDADVPEDVIAQVDEVFEMLKSGELSTGVDPTSGELLDEDEME